MLNAILTIIGIYGVITGIQQYIDDAPFRRWKRWYKATGSLKNPPTDWEG